MLQHAESSCYLIDGGRRTQVVKGEVCKTSMQRFESARRLQFFTQLTAIIYYVEGAWLRTPVGVSTTMSEKRLKSSALKVKICVIP